MELKLDYEARDSLFLSILYDDYETLYWTYRQEYNLWVSDPVKYHFKLEDFREFKTDLDAYETIADRYVVGGKNYELERIRNKIDYGDKIIRGMSQK